jgi:hypothetical protein
MRRFRGLAIFAVAAALVLLVLFHWFSHSYRMTVEVEDDGKIVTGSGIVHVSFQSNGPLSGLMQENYHMTFKGHSPLVDLGSKGVLLAALAPIDFPANYQPKPMLAGYIALVAYFGKGWSSGPENDAITNMFRIRFQRGKRVLVETDYPGLIWMPDPNNPKTAQPVMPSEIPVIIGPGVRLHSISVEIASDRNNNELFEKLSWLTAMQKYENEHGIRGNENRFEVHAAQLLGDLP